MFGEKIHRYIFLFGVCALAYGMMMGTVPTSVPQILLMANWLLEGQFAIKWQRLRGNFIFWILSSVFLAHLLGLIWTDDMNAGLNDVRTKMPMMFLPMLFLSTRTLSVREFKLLLICFLTGSVTNTLWCLAYTHLLHKNEVVRNASRFMSHIRLGLYLNIAIAVSVYLIRENKKAWQRILFALLILYFIFCMYALGLASGMANFVMLVFLFLCVIIYRQQKIIRFSFFVVLALFVSAIIFYVKKVADAQLIPNLAQNNIPQVKTPWGSSYIHFEKGGQKENGNYVLINIEMQELRRGWNRRVPQDTFSYIPETNLARYEVLVRYLASKGLNKDSLGVLQLNEEDLRNVQANIFNHRYPQWSFLHRRLYELINEYDEFRNNRHVNGHSVTMRLYFCKAALHGISQNFWTGVGTGDVQAEMNRSYRETNSPLHEEWYKRPHNQFLTVCLALGIFGFLIFVCSLVFPVWQLRYYLSGLYWTFLLVVFVSFFVEDTLETQAGQTFYAFFNSLFLSQAWWKKKSEVKESI